MNAGEFQRIVRDLSVLGDTCTIGVTKEGVKFSVKGDLGTGNIIRKQSAQGEKVDEHTIIEMEEPTELNFALRYLNFFTKV
jgi:proliferating cell nuclear antigen